MLWGDKPYDELGVMPFHGKKALYWVTRYQQNEFESIKTRLSNCQASTSHFCQGVFGDFLGHDGFYQHFITDFSKIAHPMCKLLNKETKFNIDEACLKSLKYLKELVISIPIIVAPDWSSFFKVMCDASGIKLGFGVR